MDRLVGAVLAGGSSRRMGRDKRLLRVGDTTLVERAAAALGAVLDDVVVAAGGGLEPCPGGLRTVRDRRPDQGPLAGIEAVFAAAGGRGLFVLACDLPNVGPEVVAHLIGASDPSARRAAVWYAVQGPRRQPLCGVWSAGCRPQVTAALDA
ncbi:MAG: molybdenum cofactor guanylyltransferase, partial [Thermoanaerobaculia bacterium]|nr:molybdenum cofactor guanylyltransferase [Thermoanaerobaculia bacterium]